MRSLNNNKGSFYALMVGLTMIIGGIIVFIIVNPIFEGTPGGKGFFEIGVTDLGIDNSTGSTMWTLQSTWRLVPLSFVIGGIMTIVLSSIRPTEPYPGYAGGSYY